MILNKQRMPYFSLCLVHAHTTKLYFISLFNLSISTSSFISLANISVNVIMDASINYTRYGLQKYYVFSRHHPHSDSLLEQ